MRKKKPEFFEKIPGAPKPLAFEIKRRSRFNEVDVMGVVWFGQYPGYFQEAQTELARRCGLSFKDYFSSGVSAPIIKFHAEYYQPLYLDEEFTIKASYIWSQGARLHTEYAIIKSDRSIATRGYSVQMFIDIRNKQPHIIAPEILEKLRKGWKEGKFKCLK